MKYAVVLIVDGDGIGAKSMALVAETIASALTSSYNLHGGLLGIESVTTFQPENGDRLTSPVKPLPVASSIVAPIVPPASTPPPIAVPDPPPAIDVPGIISRPE